MTNYKGYTIDNVIFNSKADIDAFLEKQAVDAYKNACWLFIKNCDVESSIYADERAAYLVNYFGYTWEQVEAIELEMLKAA